MKALDVKFKCRNCGKVKSMICDPKANKDYDATDPFWMNYFRILFANPEKYACPTPFVFTNFCDCEKDVYILQDVISYKII